MRTAARRRARDRAKRAADDRAADWASTRACPRLRRFASEVGDWPEEVEDWQWCARFCYQVIERRGTGGGNFRLMYSRFLYGGGTTSTPTAAERPPRRGPRWPPRCWRPASRTSPTQRSGRAVGAEAARVLEAEERLWPALAACGV